MGEEYGELAPFPYFVSLANPALIEAVRRGRRAEFDAFDWGGKPPDAQAESTFESARLSQHLRETQPHQQLLAYYRHLLQLRRELQLGKTDRASVEVVVLRDDDVLLVVRREHAPTPVAQVLHFGDQTRAVAVPLPPGLWKTVSNSADEAWAGPHSQTSGVHAVRTELELRLAPSSALLLTLGRSAA
jgi:maltooligosyltrehalose trehalohydrolase